MYKAITNYFKRYIFSLNFFCCVIFVIVLCMFGYVYEDMLTCNRYSPFSLLIHFNLEEMLDHYEMSAENIIINGTGSWLIMFIPIVTAFSFVPFLCDESEAKVIRYEIFRSSKLKYNLSRYLASVVMGAVVVSCGYLIFCIIVMNMFPVKENYCREVIQNYYLTREPYYIDKSVISIIILKVKDVFIYGLIWGCPAMFITSVMNNKYLIICIPFFLKYALGQMSYRIIDLAYLETSEYSETLANLAVYINPDNILYLHLYEGSIRTKIILLLFVVWITMFVGYIIIQNRRTDCGE